jgi:hypothetical protein
VPTTACAVLEVELEVPPGSPCEHLEATIRILADGYAAVERSAQIAPPPAIPRAIGTVLPAMIRVVVGSTQEYLKPTI